MRSPDLPARNVAELRDLLRSRQVSPREVIEALQDRIAEIDPQVGAYLSLDIEEALTRAETVDVDLPLGGVPIALKDIISVQNQACTCA